MLTANTSPDNYNENDSPHWVKSTHLSVFDEHAVSVVIPALNEAENLHYVLPYIPVWVSEVILVDGHSTDGTVEVAQQLMPDIRIILQDGRGKGNALRIGVTSASGDIIVMLDADGSTDPSEIPLFVGALLSGADFVKGSRFLQGAGTDDMPGLRKIGNYALTFLTNCLFGTHYTDITYGFNATWKYCLPFLALEIDGWSNEIISCIRVVRRGLQAVEVPCFEHRRVGGEAKLDTFSAGWAILKAILVERFRPWSTPSIWGKRVIIDDEIFTPAMRLLRQEILCLFSECENLKPSAREQANEVIKQTYLSLLDLETHHPEVNILKRRFRQDYEDVCEFLEFTDK